MAKFYAKDAVRQTKYDLAQLEKNIPKKIKKAAASKLSLENKEADHKKAEEALAAGKTANEEEFVLENLKKALDNEAKLLKAAKKAANNDKLGAEGAETQQKRLLEQQEGAEKYNQENLDNRAKEQAKLDQKKEKAIADLAAARALLPETPRGEPEVEAAKEPA